MKFIKKFYEDNLHLYEEVEPDTYFNFRNNENKGKISDKLFSSIKDIMKNINDNFDCRIHKLFPWIKENNQEYIYIEDDKDYWDGGVSMIILFDTDYWIWVEVRVEEGDLYYKCDDLEGFYNLIKKEWNSFTCR